MTRQLSEAKTALRKKIRARCQNIPVSRRGEASQQLCARLQESEIWRRASSVLLFAHLADEPEIGPLLGIALAAGKLVALPRFERTEKKYAACQILNPAQDLLTGQFGIREPNGRCPIIPLNRLDLILVPGIAFDVHGRRLGRGKGFYDQLLADARGQTCGVAFDEQIVADIPMEPHDIPLNCILTPTRWIEP